MNHSPDHDDLSTFAWTQSSRVARREQAEAIGALFSAAKRWLRKRLEVSAPLTGHRACAG